MTANPETLRLYASIMEKPRVGDVPSNKLASHGLEMPVGDIAKAAAAALRFQADAIEKSNRAVVDLCATMSEG